MPNVAPEKVKPPKLSEALRLGSMSTKQAFSTFGNDVSTCAIGAALVGFGYRPHQFHGLLRVLQGAGATCPRPRCESTSDVGSIMIHLNDHHRMPRNEIADWLEGLGL